MEYTRLASLAFALSVRVPGVEQKLAADAHTQIRLEQKLKCDAHTMLGVVQTPTVPPEVAADKTDCGGGDFAATLKDLAITLLI